MLSKTSLLRKTRFKKSLCILVIGVLGFFSLSLFIPPQYDVVEAKSERKNAPEEMIVTTQESSEAVMAVEEIPIVIEIEIPRKPLSVQSQEMNDGLDEIIEKLQLSPQKSSDQP